MPIGEFTNDNALDSLEKLREMFNAIAPDVRKNFLFHFSTIGTYIQATQRHLKPLCEMSIGDKPNG